MNRIVTVIAASNETALTTLERVKQELSISGSESDALLTRKIDEASSDIEAHLARTFRRETLTETVWGNPGCAEYLVLERWPVVSITSVHVDDVLVPAAEYRLDPEAGILYRLDASGYPCVWVWCKKVVIVYVGGYLLPGQTDSDLPPAVEAGAIALVQSFWLSRGRDPLVRSESVPGVYD